MRSPRQKARDIRFKWYVCFKTVLVRKSMAICVVRRVMGYIMKGFRSIFQISLDSITVDTLILKSSTGVNGQSEESGIQGRRGAD